MRNIRPVLLILLYLSLMGYVGSTTFSIAGQTDPPHQAHLELLRGPGMGGDASPCLNCHTSGSPGTGDVDLNTCNSCHSPGGAYDGVNDPNVGALNNWEERGFSTGATKSLIYESDGALRAGKEKWCATCHDEDEYSPDGGILIDNFEAYTDDTTLRAVWASRQDAQNRFLEPQSTGVTGPDGSQCMRVKLNWTNTTYTYGSVFKEYVPPIDLTDMDAVNLHLKVSDPSKIDKIKVQLIYGEPVTLYSAYVNGYQLSSGGDGWTKFRLPRASFTDTTWGLVDKIRIRIIENDSGGSHIEYVYFDNIYFSTAGPNVLGDNQTYGYYITGHNFRNCTWCHDPNSDHIDGESLPILEYVKNTPNPTNFRFYDDPAKQLRLPYNYDNTTAYNNEDFALCYWCHSETNLVGDVWGGGTNFKDRNQGTCGMSKNYHYVHVEMFADDQWPQTCIHCHDPHGQLNPAMTRKDMGDALVFDTNGCEITDEDDRHDPAVNKGLALQSNLLNLADGPTCDSCHFPYNVTPPNEPPCNPGDNPYTSAGCLNDGSYLRPYEVLPHTGGMKIGSDCFTAGCHTASQNHA
ncbi:MAG: hypothetical protein JRJ47_12085, partial [Deltaproteobacteria bacterium]|nr:hypothetical protein [Deltaproteobacteria bacterium]